MKHQFQNVYQGLRVLVTGHTGFKGGWLSLWLAELGAEVYGYALEPATTPSLFDTAKIKSQLASHEIGDIRDRQHLASYMKDIQPHIVFHLAAQPLVRLSYKEPVETYETNVMGTVYVLEAVRKTPSVRVCQVVTSDKCYENREWVHAYRENDTMGGYDPYSNSKGCSELVVFSYRQSFFPLEHMHVHGVSVSTVRAGNVIGGGDWAEDRIIPDCVRALIQDQAILIRNPSAIRPWQHVLEPLSGYLWLAAQQYRQPEIYAEAWNFGPGYTGNVSVSEMVDMVISRWGSGTCQHQAIVKDVLHEAKFLKLDIAKVSDVLAWKPVNTIKETIDMTVSWYQAWHQKHVSLDALMRQQIALYHQKALLKDVLWAVSKGEGI